MYSACVCVCVCACACVCVCVCVFVCVCVCVLLSLFLLLLFLYLSMYFSNYPRLSCVMFFGVFFSCECVDVFLLSVPAICCWFCWCLGYNRVWPVCKLYIDCVTRFMYHHWVKEKKFSWLDLLRVSLRHGMFTCKTCRADKDNVTISIIINSSTSRTGIFIVVILLSSYHNID